MTGITIILFVLGTILSILLTGIYNALMQHNDLLRKILNEIEKINAESNQQFNIDLYKE